MDEEKQFFQTFIQKIFFLKSPWTPFHTSYNSKVIYEQRDLSGSSGAQKSH